MAKTSLHTHGCLLVCAVVNEIKKWIRFSSYSQLVMCSRCRLILIPTASSSTSHSIRLCVQSPDHSVLVGRGGGVSYDSFIPIRHRLSSHNASCWIRPPYRLQLRPTVVSLPRSRRSATLHGTRDVRCRRLPARPTTSKTDTSERRLQNILLAMALVVMGRNQVT